MFGLVFKNKFRGYDFVGIVYQVKSGTLTFFPWVEDFFGGPLCWARYWPTDFAAAAEVVRY